MNTEVERDEISFLCKQMVVLYIYVVKLRLITNNVRKIEVKKQITPYFVTFLRLNVNLPDC